MGTFGVVQSIGLASRGPRVLEMMRRCFALRLIVGVGSGGVGVLGVACGLPRPRPLHIATMLFRETRLPRDAVRVLMVLACRRVAARAVSPAVPVHSRAHSFGYKAYSFPPH